MGGQSSTEQKTQQSSQTNPWEPTQGLLKDIIGGVQGQFGNTTPSAAETGAYNTINQNAQNVQNYAPQAMGLASDLQGGGTSGAQGILGNAYANYQNQLNPIANQNNDPMQTPGIRALLDTIRSDVSNQVNGQFAGAGRDLSGLNQQTLARGISQGYAQPLLNQYNQNVAAQTGAAGNLFNAGGATAQGQQALTQQGFTNRAQGLDLGINGVPQAQNAGAQGILNAAAQQRSGPLSNLAQILGLTLPIAGLGGQSTGTGSTQGTAQMSGADQFAKIAQGTSQLGTFLFSDRRVKDDIQEIGALRDGQKIYRFRYKGDPRVTIGLMADEVEQVAPFAVAEFGGVKMVDYDTATQRAASMGAK